MLCFAVTLCATMRAQTPTDIRLNADELVQYQRMKTSGRDVGGFFRRLGLQRTRAVRYLTEGDTRQLWYHHVEADTAYRATMPLYRLFKRKDANSLAVIDDHGNARATQLVFWNKAYYRRLADGLRRMGYTMEQSRAVSNVLMFRHKDIAVKVDVTIWADIYVVDVTM